jgi:hypothetical protein
MHFCNNPVRFFDLELNKVRVCQEKILDNIASIPPLLFMDQRTCIFGRQNLLQAQSLGTLGRWMRLDIPLRDCADCTVRKNTVFRRPLQIFGDFNLSLVSAPSSPGHD